MSVLKSCSMIAGAELWAETLQLNRSCIWLGKLAAVFISEFVKENVFWLAGLIVAASKGMTCMLLRSFVPIHLEIAANSCTVWELPANVLCLAAWCCFCALPSSLLQMPEPNKRRSGILILANLNISSGACFVQKRERKPQTVVHTCKRALAHIKMQIPGELQGLQGLQSRSATASLLIKAIDSWRKKGSYELQKQRRPPVK
eukprot:1143314-Pelagomonas_calceolata.AAC.1